MSSEHMPSEHMSGEQMSSEHMSAHLGGGWSFMCILFNKGELGDHDYLILNGNKPVY